MVIRRIVLDAFGTVFSPREPVFAQYTQVAREYGLAVTESAVKSGFKSAFSAQASAHPLYGKHSTPPLSPSAWWASVIHSTFLHAGVPASSLSAVSTDLTTSLITRFHGPLGYALHADVRPFLARVVRELSLPPVAVASNTDPSLLVVLRELGVLQPRLGEGEGGISEGEVWTTWEIERGKKEEAFWREVVSRLGVAADEVLIVGDELASDVLAPRSAGLHALLLRRPPPPSSQSGTDSAPANYEHARASYADERDGVPEDVEIVQGLEGVVEWVRKMNGRGGEGS
ncbi:hypothetical protein JCM10207_006284 [Rhodosporidiobolus poonsookiae]